MGKQNRRKQRNSGGGGSSNKKNNHKKESPIAAAASSTSATTTSTPTPSPFANVVKRIRHVDPKVRLASLLGLQSTLAFDYNTRLDEVKAAASTATSSSLPKSSRYRQVSLDILQAVREQVMMNDTTTTTTKHLECSTAATECLVQYLKLQQLELDEQQELQQEQEDLSSFTNPAIQKVLTTTASWSLLFLGRLQQCQQQIQQIINNSITTSHPSTSSIVSTTTTSMFTNNKQNNKELFIWYNLTVSCLQGLCYLIETNPITFNYIVTTCSMKQNGISILPTIIGLIETVFQIKYLYYYNHQHESRIQNEKEESNSTSTVVADSAMVEDDTTTSATATATSAATAGTKKQRKKKKKKKKSSAGGGTDEFDFTLMDQTAIYACRILHSSLDPSDGSSSSIDNNNNTTRKSNKNKKNGSSSTIMINFQQELADLMMGGERGGEGGTSSSNGGDITATNVSATTIVPKLSWSTAFSTTTTTTTSSTTTPLLPIQAQLHLAGCLVMALGSSSTTTGTSKNSTTSTSSSYYWTEHVLYHAIPCLLKQLGSGSSDDEQQLQLQHNLVHVYDTYQIAKKLAKQQEQDNTMEQEILQKINQKPYESARDIARRQKQHGRPTTQTTTSTTTAVASGVVNDNEMMDTAVLLNGGGDVEEEDNLEEDHDEDDMQDQEGTEDGSTNPSKVKDGVQAMEDAQREWTALLDPLELCLEVSTNLLDALIPKSADDDEDYGMAEDDDEDDDDVPMDQDDMESDDAEEEAFRAPILQSLIQANLFSFTFQMLQQIGTLKNQLLKKEEERNSRMKLDNNSSSNNDSSEDEDVNRKPNDPLIQDLDNIITKLSGCLVNCLLSDCVSLTQEKSRNSSSAVDSKTTTAITAQQIWQGLKQYVYEEGISSVMVVAVQHYAPIRELVLWPSSSSSAMTEIDFLLQLLEVQPGATAISNATPSPTSSSVGHAKLQRDIVCLLAAVVTPSSEDNNNNQDNSPHGSAAIAVKKITSKFLALLEHATMVTTTTTVAQAAVACEVLNAFMDIFAQDDLYNDIFQNLDVLMKFEKCVGKLRHQQEQKTPSFLGRSWTLMELEEQEEIVHNAQRFVEYKQQHASVMMH